MAMNQTQRALLICILALSFARNALALRIVACEPEWAALAGELGGTKVEARSATRASQDTHHIEPRPSLIAMVRNADLLVCTGLRAEEDWLPALLAGSGNSKIQTGQLGYFEAGNYVQKREAFAWAEYAQGNVRDHAGHHVHSDPRNISLIADALVKRMVETDPHNADYYLARYNDFSKRWSEGIRRWEKQAAPLKGMGVVQHHNAWTYLCHWLGLREVASLEPRKGEGTTTRHLEAVLATLKQSPANIILSAPYDDPRDEKWLAQRTKLPVVVLPMTVGSTERAKDLFGLFDDTIQRLLAATNGSQ